MKCLEKDRNRRYETANGLARDIERYLSDEPVQAGPPSAAYRFRKFARRNRVAMFVASAAVSMLLVLVTGLIISNRLIAAQRAHAEAERERAEAEHQRAQVNFRRARTVVQGVLSQAAMGIGEWSRLPPSLRTKFAAAASGFFESFLQEDSTDASQRYETAVAYRALSELNRSIKEMQSAENFVRKSIAILDGLTSQDPKALDYKQQLAYSRYMLGVLMQQTKRPTEAEAEVRQATSLYESLIAERPGQFDYYNEIQMCYAALIRMQKSRKASQEVEQTVQRLLALPGKVPPTAPDAAQIHLSIARGLDRLGRTDDVIAACQELIRRFPNDGMAHFDLAVAHESKRNHEEAIRLYHKVIELLPNFAAVAHHNIGFNLAEQGKFEEAAAATRKAIELAPDFDSAYYNLANSLKKLGRFDEAIAAYRQSLALSPDHAPSHFNLGNTFSLQGKLDEAVAAYKKSIELEPSDANAYTRLGDALTEQGKLDESLAAYRTAAELNPRSAEAYNGVGNQLAKQGKPEEATVWFRKSLEHKTKKENRAITYLNLGVELHNQGKFDEAIAAYGKALELQPKFARVHGSLGNALLYKDKLAEAAAAYKKAIELDPNLDNVYWNLAVLLSEQKKFDEADAAYRKAIEEMGKDATQLNDRAWRSAMSTDPQPGDASRAVELARKATAIKPENGAYWNTLGVAQYRAGNWQSAIDAFDKSMQLRNGGDAADWFVLSMAHWQLGHKDEARTWYDKAAKWMNRLDPSNPELRRFRDEADKLFGATEPKPPAAAAPTAEPKKADAPKTVSPPTTDN